MHDIYLNLSNGKNILDFPDQMNNERNWMTMSLTLFNYIIQGLFKEDSEWIWKSRNCLFNKPIM